ncbi:hypothetical protein CPC08DRAFT_737663 [Agrocybe pediades]|nr:hypothetical protein CPC08DRAFT_737663 [Agrocybe pediades]
MSKRPGSSPPATKGTKRARIPSGFRLAKPASQRNHASSNLPATDTTSRSTLFVTVNKPGSGSTLRAQKLRVLNSTKTQDASEDSLPDNEDGGAAVDLEENEIDSDNSRVQVVDVPGSNNLGKQGKRERKTKNVYSCNLQDHFTHWLEFRETFLDETLRHDGLGDFIGRTVCSDCGVKDGELKCKDCAHGSLLRCTDCIINAHRHLPLHRTEKWNGAFFDRFSLQAIGLRYQLGHSGGPCPNPSPGPANFVVFCVTGPHFVSVDFCNCLQKLPPYTQLLREKWFPATLTRPQTVFTFDSMEMFHELTLQGKTSLYDYYHTLLRRFDNAGLHSSINRFTEVHRVFRMWRNLMALKRAGRGHDPDGVSGTASGELLLECAACPHPGKNLPVDWETQSGLLFLYTLFVAVDGNFKLKGKERHLDDVELMPGWGAYVHEGPYQTHIANYVDEPELNTCHSQHDAIVRAATRSSPGYAVSGATLVICSRHCLVRRNGAGDLQKGEKYCNVDFVVLSALIGISLLRVVLTYDIGCQWSKNFRKRMEDLPTHMHIPDSTKVQVAIPSWHINGHGSKCRENFNLGYMAGVGRTIGEEVETTWPGTNLLASSIREMGPAARHDTLNDHWGGMNFQKTVGFGNFFARRYAEALKMRKKQTEIYNRMASTFTPATISKWEAMVAAWEANPKAPNPYSEAKTTTTLNDVRLLLAQEDANQAQLGQLPRHKISPTTLLLTGFELEDSQYLLRRDALQLKNVKTSKVLATLQERRNALMRQIRTWREAQLAYIPHVASLIISGPLPTEGDVDNDTTSAGSSNVLAEDIPLFLPSALPQHIRRLADVQDLCRLERRLREPQAEDALATIRKQRRVIQGLWRFKKFNTAGTGNRPNTRMLTLYNGFQKKTKRAIEQYRTAWRALSILDPNGTWATRLKELKDSDVRGPAKEDSDVSKGRYEPSWIWLSEKGLSDTELNDDEFRESMRVEWAQARARMKRWEEEVLLLREEMRRVLEYHKWKATWWESQAKRRNSNDAALNSGLAGYASKQAAIQLRRAKKFAFTWFPVLRNDEAPVLWLEEYREDRRRAKKDAAPSQVTETLSTQLEMEADEIEGSDTSESGSAPEDEIEVATGTGDDVVEQLDL